MAQSCLDLRARENLEWEAGGARQGQFLRDEAAADSHGSRNQNTESSFPFFKLRLPGTFIKT